LVAVQYAAEQHAIRILKQALELAAKEGRITLQHVDFEAAARLVRA
jgi:histone H3/H4